VTSDPLPAPRVSVYEPLLGTVVEVRVHAADSSAAALADARILAEMRRLEHIFSVFDETSELCRWRRGEDFEHSTEFVELLRTALHWQVAGGGAFNPAAGVVSRAWVVAAREGREPDAGLLAELAESISAPRYRVDGDAATRIGDCSSLNFNAIAKGFVVDRAVDAGMTDTAVTSVTVNAGGDLCHRGEGSLAVGIENPATPYDNAVPLMVVDIANRGLATSGSSRRGFRIGGRRYSHVLDPRTGHPVGHIRSATVIAADAGTADATATVTGVLDASAGVAFVDALDDAGSCVVDADGTLWRSTGWADYERVR